MLRAFYLILLICFVFPLTVYSGGSEEHLISKQELICLYVKSEDYLDVLSDKPDGAPHIVYLKSKCGQSGDIRNDILTRSMEIPKPPSKVNDDSDRRAHKDPLVLTYKQIDCFKQNYKDLLNDDRDPLPVEFSDSCE